MIFKSVVDNSICVETLIYPYSAVGIVHGFIGNKSFFGTGFLISSNIVLTCGHNLYHRK